MAIAARCSVVVFLINAAYSSLRVDAKPYNANGDSRLRMKLLAGENRMQQVFAFVKGSASKAPILVFEANDELADTVHDHRWKAQKWRVFLVPADAIVGQ